MNPDNVMAANKYAKAMLEVLQENNQLDDEYKELESLRLVFINNPKLAGILSGKDVKNEFKQQLLETIKDGASQFMQNFLDLIESNQRFDDLVLIIDQFIKVYQDEKKIVYAEVTSATELSEDQKDRIAKTFEKRVSANQVILSTKVDASIIGGIILRSADTVIDGSVKNRINKVKQLLLN